MFLSIVSVEAFNRATGVQVDGPIAVCAAIQRGSNRAG